MKLKNGIISYLVYIYIILLPLVPENIKYRKIPINGDLVLALLIIVYLCEIGIYRDTRNRFVNGVMDFFKDYLSISMIIWIFMMWASITYSVDKKAGLGETLRFTSYVVLFFIIKYELTIKKILDNIIKIYIVVSTIIGSVGIIQYIYRRESLGKIGGSVSIRITSTLGNANNVGMFFIICIFPLTILFINEKIRRKKIVYLIIILISIVNIVASGSRNALIGLLVGYGILVLGYCMKLIFAYIGIVLAVTCIPGANNRLKQIFDASQNLSRIKIWNTSLVMIKKHPILGIGNGNFNNWYNIYSKKFNKISDYDPVTKVHPHNAFLKAQCELGIVGFASFTCFMVISLVKIKHAYKKFEDGFEKSFYKGFFISIVVFSLMNLIDNFFSAPKVIAFFWILLAVSQALLFNFINSGKSENNLNKL